MARKSRSPITSPRQRDTTPVARSAAASRSLSYWTDLPQSRPDVSRPASVVRRTKRHPLVAQPPLKRPSRPFSFGAWSLPPSLSPKVASTALSCARRGIRREVLFAKKFTGAGSHSRKKYYSNRRCK